MLLKSEEKNQQKNTKFIIFNIKSIIFNHFFSKKSPLRGETADIFAKLSRTAKKVAVSAKIALKHCKKSRCEAPIAKKHYFLLKKNTGRINNAGQKESDNCAGQALKAPDTITFLQYGVTSGLWGNRTK